MKSKKFDDMLLPAVWKDVIISFVITLGIAFWWAYAHFLFGDEQKLSTTLTSFFGALIAIAALLVKQYSIKDTLDYLITWQKIESLVNGIATGQIPVKEIVIEQIKPFILLNQATSDYVKYVKQEIFIISLTPSIMVVLYGTALICDKSIFGRGLCLFLMLHLLIYLTMATITSNQIAIKHLEYKDAISLLESVLHEMDKINSNLNKEPT